MKGKKTGGRTIGTPNRITTTVRQVISTAVDTYYNSQQFIDDIAQLDPKDRVTVFERLSAYVIPKLQSTTLDTTITTQRTIEDRLLQLSTSTNTPSTDTPTSTDPPSTDPNPNP